MTDRDANCAYHHATPATAACSVCEKPLCDICAMTVNARSFCGGCGAGLITQKPWLAAVFSLFLPGSGQVYNGQWGKAVAVFLLAPLVVPWLWGVVDAAGDAAKIAAGEKSAATVPTGCMLLGVKVLLIPAAIVYALLASAVIMALAGLLSG